MVMLEAPLRNCFHWVLLYSSAARSPNVWLVRCPASFCTVPVALQQTPGQPTCTATNLRVGPAPGGCQPGYSAYRCGRFGDCAAGYTGPDALNWLADHGMVQASVCLIICVSLRFPG